MYLPHLQKNSMLALVIAIAAGYAGNYFSLPLFFGVDFLFGSIAVLLVVRFFGVIWGTLAAIIAGTYTIILWNHPYAAIVLTCEALFVGWRLRGKYQNSIVLLDVVYWLCLGIPLVWLFYSQVLHVDNEQTLLIVLKQSVNGIFNAIITSLLITYLPIHKWVCDRQINNTPSLRQVILNLSIAVCFLPALMLIILDCQVGFVHIEKEIQTEINSTAKELITNLQYRQQQYFRSLSQLGQVAATSDMTASPKLLQSMELMLQVNPDFLTIEVFNTAGKVIASYPTPSQGEAVKQSILPAVKNTLSPVISNVHIHHDLNIAHADLSVPILAGDRFVGGVYTSLDLSYISQFLRSQSSKVQKITLVDSEKQIVASTDSKLLPMQVFNSFKIGEMQPFKDGIYLWQPPKGKLPAIVRWCKSIYIKEVAVNDNPAWKIVLEIPAAPYISHLQEIYTNDLAFMLLTAILALICGVLLSRSLNTPLSQLAAVTTNLPDKLLERETIKWPDSSVTEINSLISNFKFMALTLNEKFQEIQNINQTLKRRVQKRTKSLLQTNKKLAEEITEHRLTGAALRESEERYRDLFENANDLIQSVSLQGDFLYVNRAWRETLGYNEAEIQDLKVFNIIHPDSLAHCQEMFHRLMSGESIEQVETVFITKEGKKIWVEGSINCKFVDGKPMATREIFRNITERKQAEAEISYALEKERQLIELKARFITTASHEFRTPLTTIFMSAKLLEQFGDRATEEKKRLYIDRIQAATKRMTQLLDEVLVIGKAEAGKLEFNPVTLYLEKFCHELVEEMQMGANGKHVINLEIGEDYTNADVDEKLLRYIISNLLSNAIKYSPRGGDINFQLTIEQEKAILKIQDRGIGIPPEDREKLFASFHRGSNVENISGTGLGMSIVKQCVDLHGGEITVESEVGVGTTFIVILPLKQYPLTDTEKSE